MFSLTFWIVFSGCVLLGMVSAVIGCFALLRRQSLLGDALAHASLPGVCLAFWVTQGHSPFALLIGALITGILGALLVQLVVRSTKIKEDAALGVVLSVFFGVGIVLLSVLQKRAFAGQSGLDRFLFGQAATMLPSDVWRLVGVAVIVLVVVLAFFNSFKLTCFDAAYAATLGLPVRRIEIALTLLLVVVVTIGLQTAGAVLMIAALITPAAAARQWTRHLGPMLLVAGLLGGIASGVGVWASAIYTGLPTGPAIVLTSTVVLAASLLLAPKRGVLWERLRAQAFSRRIRCENLLKDLYRYAEDHNSWHSSVSTGILMGIRGHSASGLKRVVTQLCHAGLLSRNSAGQICLTQAGIMEAGQVVRKHRLWELYLTKRLSLSPEVVHRDAEAMEHVLSDDMVELVTQLLNYPTTDPHGRPIPPPENLTKENLENKETR